MNQDKGTSNNLPISIEADEEAVKNFNIEKHLIRLMFDEPFYSTFLRTIKIVKTDSIPTAGVLAQDGEVRMWYNPKFLASLTDDQIKGLLIHEIWHVILEHTTTRRLNPHIIHNYATDLAINSNIREDWLPEGGLIPGSPFKELTEAQVNRMTADQIQRYERVSSKIASFPKHESSEWYFARLMEDDQIAKDIQDDAKGKSLEQALADGDIDIDEDGNVFDKDGNPVDVRVLPGEMDSHEDWGNTSDEEKDLISDKVKKALEKAIEKSDASGKWGSVSATNRAHLRTLISNEVDWRSILKKFVGSSRRGTRTTSWTRLNKKYAGRVQGVKRGYTSSIAVYIDQSGSVCNDSLELAFANLRNLAKRTEFVTYHFDTTVDEKSETVWKKGKTPEAMRTRCGGTDFESVTLHANKNRHRFDGFLVITDGEAPKPSHSKLKRGWLIVPGRDLAFDPDNSDFVMKMKESA